MSKRGNGEGSVYRRKDGRWEAAVTLRGDRKRVCAKTRQQASQWLTATMRAKEEGLPIGPARATVATHLNSWLAGARSQLRHRTWVRYEQLARLHVLPALGAIPLGRLEPSDVKVMQQRMLEAGASPSSTRQARAVLHGALTEAVRWGLVARNVAALVRPPQKPAHEMRTLTQPEVGALFAAAAGDRLEALWVLAATVGMRQGELLGLRWRDVDLDRGVLGVCGSLTRGPQGLMITDPKTARSRRRVALPAIAVEALRRHRATQAGERLRAGAAWTDRDLVFSNGLGGPLTADKLLRARFRPLLRKAGLPPIRFHDLRHTAATRLLEQGVHPKVVSEMLGHASVAITLDIYSHVSPDLQRQAVSALDALFSKQLSLP
ncbi:MAG: site-specific integrase [Chloroflexi bacterium]|nr:MAG: site-specific integrase [Chloroflexota bacterium]